MEHPIINIYLGGQSPAPTAPPEIEDEEYDMEVADEPEPMSSMHMQMMEDHGKALTKMLTTLNKIDSGIRALPDKMPAPTVKMPKSKGVDTKALAMALKTAISEESDKSTGKITGLLEQIRAGQPRTSAVGMS